MILRLLCVVVIATLGPLAVHAVCSGACSGGLGSNDCYTNNANPCECVCSEEGQCVPNRLPPIFCEDICGSVDCVFPNNVSQVCQVDGVCDTTQPPLACCPDNCQATSLNFQCRQIDQCCMGAVGGCTVASQTPTNTPTPSMTPSTTPSTAPVCPGTCTECGSACNSSVGADGFYCGNSIQQCGCACQAGRCIDNQSPNQAGLLCQQDLDCNAICTGCQTLHCNLDIGCCECFDCQQPSDTPTGTPSQSPTRTSSLTALPTPSNTPTAGQPSQTGTPASATGGGGGTGGDVNIDIAITDGGDGDDDDNFPWWVLFLIGLFSLAVCAVLLFFLLRHHHHHYPRAPPRPRLRAQPRF